MPTPDPDRLLTALALDLAAAGATRRPSQAPTGSPSAPGPPPLIVEPAGGAPAPGEGRGTADDPTLVVSLTLSSGVTMDRGAENRRRHVLAFTYRSREQGDAAAARSGLRRGRAVDAAVRGLLLGNASRGVGLTLGQSTPAPVFVLDVQPYAELGPVDDSDGVRTERASFVFEVLAT